MNAFHLSLPCHNVKATGDFYVNKLGGTLGRSKDKWVDINLHGNQITFTQSGTFNFISQHYRFDKTVLPSFHFGILLGHQSWEQLLERLSQQGLVVIPATTFLKHKKGQHDSFFVKDPNDFHVEFKTFKEPQEVFEM